MKKKKKLNKHNKKNKKVLTNIKKYNKYNQTSITSVINKRFKALIVLVILLFSALAASLYYVQMIKNDYYKDQLKVLSQVIIDGGSPARGRIYDRNGRVIVDNKAVKTIYYKKSSGVTTNEEVIMAYKIANAIKLDYSRLNDYDLKNFWIINNPRSAKQKITDEEWKKLDERKITLDDIQKYKIERVTKEDLSEYEELDKKAAYIYYLMNNGYYYAEKIIKNEDVTDEEYAFIAENSDDIKGFGTKLDWEREYPYGDVFRTILGNVSSSANGLPAELKDSYLAMGYSMSDRVGTSYLEYQYESILRGTKTKYTMDENGNYVVLEEGERGNDIVLSIDIELQKKIEKIVSEELIYTRVNDKYTKYFDRAFVVISDPNTGEILAMVGKRLKEEDGEYKVYDMSAGVINASITPGSSVKAASHMVGYVTGNLKIGEVRNDACIKIAATPLKCSYTMYGNINDAQALSYSSNTYQFQTAIKVGKGKYRYDQPLILKDEAFDTYRDIFSEFGLGVKTGIDLPNEALGFKGNGTAAGLLLDFSIGQYDNYTPIQMSQYINTVATKGTRIKPTLLKKVYAPDKDGLTSLIYTNPPTVLNRVDADKKYFDRIHEGLHMVFANGTGYGFIDNKYKPAGKTGTSESFVDSDGDGKIDTETLSTSLVAYAPYDNPTVTFTVITPNVGTGDINFGQMSKVNKRLAQKISKKYFEIYK